VAQFRNRTDETVIDWVTKQTAEPDAVIDVSDEYADLYRPHATWDEVGGARQASTQTSTTPVVVTTPIATTDGASAEENV
jgi:hypothetical protein